MNPISVAEAREMDRHAVEDLGMPSILLMENAARAVADAARELGSRFAVVCGPGNNGGDGLAAVRLLGPENCVYWLPTEPDPHRVPDAATQLSILRAAGWEPSEEWPAANGVAGFDSGLVWIDALFGTGLGRKLSGRAKEMVQVMNRSPAPVVAVDVPSGLDADTGLVVGSEGAHDVASCAVRATRTVTFATPKHGLLAQSASDYVGELLVGPLGIPAVWSSR